MQLPPPLKSTSHPLARQMRLIARGVRERRELGLFLVEGPRGLEEALEARARLVCVLAGVSQIERRPAVELLSRCHGAGIPIQPVQDQLLQRLSPTEQGPGLVGFCSLPAAADDPAPVLAAGGLLVVAWKVQHPGNVGTLIRSSLAFGAAGLISAGGADPWTPKAVRASAGAVHRLPLARAAEGPALLEMLQRGNRPLIAAEARSGADPESIDWSGDPVLFLGSEVAGLPAELGSRIRRVTIPTLPAVESLSVGVAGSLLLYSARRA